MFVLGALRRADSDFRVSTSCPYFFFFGDAAFFALAATDLTVFGLGAFGFLVGAFAVFFALDGDDFVVATAAAAAGAGALDFFWTAFTAAAFLVFAAVFGLAGEALAAAGAAFFFFFSGVATAAATFFGFAFDANFGFFVFVGPLLAANLNEPEAPFPLVCTNEPVCTADFKYFLMKGAIFSGSTL